VAYIKPGEEAGGRGSEIAIFEVKLVDAETNAPIRYTPVWLGTYQIATDEKGIARFDVPLGTYTLKVRSPVYEPYTTTITTPGSYEIKLRRILL
jgi:hypothetical protein